MGWHPRPMPLDGCSPPCGRGGGGRGHLPGTGPRTTCCYAVAWTISAQSFILPWEHSDLLLAALFAPHLDAYRHPAAQLERPAKAEDVWCVRQPAEGAATDHLVKDEGPGAVQRTQQHPDRHPAFLLVRDGGAGASGPGQQRFHRCGSGAWLSSCVAQGCCCCSTTSSQGLLHPLAPIMTSTA